MGKGKGQVGDETSGLLSPWTDQVTAVGSGGVPLVQASMSPIPEAIHRKDKQVTEGSRTQYSTQILCPRTQRKENLSKI